ncbi:MAG: ubiquinol-cytochrome C chaperone [Alphaproteobacteria bacterium]|nr:ubiquinol-cytochrome C chaperone [Alphaproteobacteria bacterium]
MSIFHRLFSNTDARDEMRPLYEAIVARAREPHWYAQGGVPDTLDGRFDMVAAILSAVLLRLEPHPQARQQSVWLTEIFVDDMDGQLRQIGIGDMIVGKHIGKMMSALGGRLSAYRTAFAGAESLDEALVRNLYRGDPPAAPERDHVVQSLTTFWQDLGTCEVSDLLDGKLP